MKKITSKKNVGGAPTLEETTKKIGEAKMKQIQEKRFLGKIEKTESCWLWKAFKNPCGYGQYWINGKDMLAHRYSWIKANGEIPEGMNVLHKCDVPTCVNPDHLFIGSQMDNVIDMRMKGRQGEHLRGEQLPSSKLTQIQVNEIRKVYKPGRGPFKCEYSQAGLARKYGVSCQSIGAIVNNKLWVNL